MCVIMTAEQERPTKKELRAAAQANPHGAGIAWVEDGAVRFEKVGEDAEGVERIIALSLRVPLPFVVHFRITSSGVTAPELSHPFPIRHKKADATSGATGAVLFHNGTWREWRGTLLAAAASTGQPVGDGPMSDSKAMAYLAATLGRGILSTIPSEQRLAVLAADGTVTRFGKGWSEYADGLWVSNMNWKPVARDEGGKAKGYLLTSDMPRLVKKG